MSSSALLRFAVARISCLAGPGHKLPVVLQVCVNNQVSSKDFFLWTLHAENKKG